MRKSDIAIVIVVAGLQVIACATIARANGEALDAVGYVLLVVPALALLWRRDRPVVVLGATLVPAIGFFALGYDGPAVLAVLVAMVTAVLRGRRRVAWLAGAAVLAVHLIAQSLADSDSATAESLGGQVGWWLVVLLGAEFARARRERQAEQWRQRLEEQRRVASEERLAIARELHDVVAHSIAVINVQAGIALHLRSDIPRAFDTLTTIRQVSAEALGELKETLGVLRGEVDAPLPPAPDVHALDGLVAQAEAAGLDVELELGGRLAGESGTRLPAAVAQAAYRLVQESVTNTIRHSGSDTVRIELDWTGDELGLAVSDRGSGLPAQTRIGNGLRGMRERVDALGGEFDVSPRPGGGWTVRARIPVPVPDDDGEPLEAPR